MHRDHVITSSGRLSPSKTLPTAPSASSSSSPESEMVPRSIEMASLASARSIFRSSSVRNVASKVASEAKAYRSPFRAASNRPASRLILRTPAEASACLELMMPYHTATSSALMTSMLFVSRRSNGWLPEGRAKTR